MPNRNYDQENTEKISGYDYESAYFAAENAKLDVKDDKARRERAAWKDGADPKENVRRRKEFHKKQKQKRLWIILAAAVLCIAAAAIIIVAVSSKKEEIPEEEGIAQLEISGESVVINEIYTYGTHLGMTGTLSYEVTSVTDDCTVDLVLYNGEFITVPVIVSEGTFTLSEEYNNGLYLDDIPRDTYTMFIRVTSDSSFESETETAEAVTEEATEEEEQETSSGNSLQRKKPEETTTTEETTASEDEDGNTVSSQKYYRYYALVNATDYQETVYYTMSSYNNCIVIGGEETYPTMQISVSENTDEDVYDVVLDAGRGGTDLGATGVDGHHEIDFLLPLTLKVKEDLEAMGMKVALTRSSDSETVSPYGENGRIARACVSKAKYMISIRMNSGSGSGLEIYAYQGLDYTFAQTMSEKIQEASGLGCSTAAGSVGSGIYCKMFSQSDIDEELEDNKADGLTPYEPTLRSSYYYIIRESGGIVTGAFKDDRNPGEEYNPYCYSNTGIETYVAELGYITDEGDVQIMQEKSSEIAQAIADSLLTVYKN